MTRRCLDPQVSAADRPCSVLTSIYYINMLFILQLTFHIRLSKLIVSQIHVVAKLATSQKSPVKWWSCLPRMRQQNPMGCSAFSAISSSVPLLLQWCLEYSYKPVFSDKPQKTKIQRMALKNIMVFLKLIFN